MVELFANSGDPDQMPHSAASDLGLHCLPITLLGVSRLHLVNHNSNSCYNPISSHSPRPAEPRYILPLQTV